MRDFSRFSENKFINEVRQIRWNIVIEKHCRNVDKLFSSFYNKLNKLVNKHVPRKNVTKRDMKNFSKPWISAVIKRSIKEKNRLLTQGEHEKYKYYRNRISTLIRVSKKKYYYEYFEINLNKTPAQAFTLAFAVGKTVKYYRNILQNRYAVRTCCMPAKP